MIARTLTRMMFGVALIAGAGVYAPGARAQSPLVNPNPSPAAVALARDLIVIKGVAPMFEAAVPGVIESAKNMFAPTNPQLSKPLGEVSAQLMKDFEPKKAEVLTEVARIYARRFTEQELKELIAFYKTNLGKKVLAEEPLAAEDGIKRAQDWANTFSEQVINRMRVEMKKKGYDL